MPKELLGLLEGGGVPTVEQLLEEDNEEEQGEQPPPRPVRRGHCRHPSQRRSGPWAHDAPGLRCPIGEAGGTHQQEGPGEGACHAGIAAPGDG